MDTGTPVDHSFSTLVEMLRRLSADTPDRIVYTYLTNGEEPGPTLGVGQLDRRARAIAAVLQARGCAGQRVLLPYPQGLDFLAGFFGCMYAGAIAVPIAPPAPGRPGFGLAGLTAVVKDAEPRLILSTQSLSEFGQPLFACVPELAEVPWLASDSVDLDAADAWQEPAISGDTLAYLQYTSGSTSTPKGVMVAHKNVMANLAGIDEWSESSPGEGLVTWLPQFHNMGLVYALVFPLRNHMSCYVMSPMDFLRKPLVWLQAISRFRATYSVAPNFAFDLCVQKISEEERSRLDLSCWRVAVSGAEPIRWQCLKGFAEAFRPCGFDMKTFKPGYGLAEAVLHISTVPKSEGPVCVRARTDALEKNRIVPAEDADTSVREIVGCGHSYIDTQIRIVCPDRGVICQDSEVGEIWLGGSTISQGYWRNPGATEEAFTGYLADTGEGPFLRTGDVGFVRGGQLFVTGRIKDMIIVRGANHYPQDVESTAMEAHETLRTGGACAFSVDVGGQERLVVLQELREEVLTMSEEELQRETAGAIAAIRRAVSREHDLQAHGILLLRPGSLLRTPGGKIQRSACRTAFLEGRLDTVAKEVAEAAEGEAFPAGAEHVDWAGELRNATPGRHRGIIESYLCRQTASLLRVDEQRVSLAGSFLDLGMDSLKAMELIGCIEKDLGIRVEPRDFFEHASVAGLAEYLETAAEGRSAATEDVFSEEIEEGGV